MSSRKAKTTVLSVLSSILIICIVAVIVVQSGAWATFSNATGIGTPITSAAQLLPSERDKRKVGVTIPVPSLPSTATASGGTASASASASSTGGIIASAKSPITYAEALKEAKSMETATPHLDGYSGNRETLFGTWVNSDQLCGSGTTRDYILKRDLTNVVSNSKCQVESGTFDDPYTGTTIRFQRGVNTSSKVQIDHVVALQDAWASGLWKQSRADERVSYANDPYVLMASDGSANTQKGAGVDFTASSNPVWLPSNAAWRCDYMGKRVAIKHKYGLTMTVAEKAQTVSVLTACAAG